MPLLIHCRCGRSFRADESSAGQEHPCPHCGQPLVIAGERVLPWDVFLSYSAKDKVVADAAVATLESKGIRCWIAPRDIVPGREWSEAIIEGIEQSRALVLVFSSNSNSSQQVLREVEGAVHRGMPIVPFRLEDIPASKAMEYFISCHHWLDAYRPPLEEHLEKLRGTLDALLGSSRPPQPIPRAQPVQDKPKPAARRLLGLERRPRLVIGLALLLVVVVSLTAVGIHLLHERAHRQAEIVAQVEAASDACDAELDKRVHKDYLPKDTLEQIKDKRLAAKSAEKEGRLADALELYNQVPEMLKKASLPRLKGLAFWLGFGSYSHWYFHNHGGEPKLFPTGYEWTLQNPCREQLGLDGHLIDDLLKKPGQGDREREDLSGKPSPQRLRKPGPTRWMPIGLAFTWHSFPRRLN